MELYRIIKKLLIVFLIGNAFIVGILIMQINKDDSQHSLYADLILEYNNNEEFKLDDYLESIGLEDYTLSSDISGIISKFEGYIDYILNYSNNKQIAIKNAEEMSKSSLFMEENTYSYKNIKKSRDDAIDIKDAQVSVGNTLAIEKLMDYRWTSIIFVMMIVVILLLFNEEKYNGVNLLIRSSAKKRTKLVFDRFMILLGFIMINAFIINAIIFMIFLYNYGGISDLNIVIQSSEMFKNFPFVCTIKQFFILYCALFGISMFAVSLILYVLVQKSSTSKTAYLKILLMSGLEYIFYTTISIKSIFNVLKFFNIFSMIMIEDSILKINWGNDYFITDSLITLFCLLILSLIMGLGLNLIIYYMNYPIRKVGLIEKLFEKISVVIQGIVGKCNSFVMEMYKIIILQKGWLIFIIFILAMNYNSIHKGLNYGSQNIYLKKYYDMFAGEKIGKDEYDFLEELKIEKNVVINSSDETAYNMLKANQIKDAIEHIEQQLNYLEELKKNNIEGCIIDESPYVEVFGERLDGFNETQGLICILTMILLFSNIFNIEKKTKMQVIIRSSFGRRKVWNEKTGCTLAISTIVTLITIGFKWRNICKYYDLSNMDVPIQSISMMKGCPLSVSICGYIIITNIIFIMATIAISLVIMCLSYYVGYVQSIAICFISMVPYLLYVFKLKVMEYLSIPVLLDINRTLVKTGFGIYISLVYITLFVVTMAIMIRTYKRWNE